MLLKVASGEKGQSGGLSRGFDWKPLDGSQQTRSRLSAERWSEVEKIFLTGSAAACHFGLVMTLSDFVGEHGALSINSQCCLHLLMTVFYPSQGSGPFLGQSGTSSHNNTQKQNPPYIP